MVNNAAFWRWMLIVHSGGRAGSLTPSMDVAKPPFQGSSGFYCHVLTFFASPSFSAVSPSPFLFSPFVSPAVVSRPPNAAFRLSDGVGKTKGLGNTAEPLRPESYHSLKKLLGLGNRSLFMYRLGRAEMGVSMLFRLSPYASRFWFDVGGGGRAKGLGGPLAPADMTAEALGDGGGSTM